MSNDSNDTFSYNDENDRILDGVEVELNTDSPIIEYNTENKEAESINSTTEYRDKYVENLDTVDHTAAASAPNGLENEDENELFFKSLGTRPHFESDLEDAEDAAEYLSSIHDSGSNSFSLGTASSLDEEDADYHPGDMIDLRGLFDENAVVQRRLSTALDFEEIPDDIDIDEPVEVEELSRAGKILNFIVKISFIFFALLIIAFIFNVGLFIAAVIIHNKSPAKVFVNITDLDKSEATINIRVKTEASSLGGWVKGYLDNKNALNAAFYLSNSETPSAKDAMFEIKYLNLDQEIHYDGKESKTIDLNGVKMRLNPDFDASRLSGFMEPKINNVPHKRFPLRAIIKFSMGFFVYFFGVPIPYPINMTTVLKFDENTEEARAAAAQAAKNMAQFDFNPKFVKFSPIDSEGKIKLHIRQPIPKFFAPKPYEISVQIPKLSWNMRQFTMLDPSDAPEIQHQIDNSQFLAQAVSQPFTFNVVDSLAPNIIDFEAVIFKDSLPGLMNVLQSIRDNKLKTLAFLVLSSQFKKKISFEDEAEKIQSESKFPLLFPALQSPGVFEADKYSGCNFSHFMSSFWARQPFPVGDGSQPIPSVPELYDPTHDSAINIKFQGIKSIEPGSPRRALSFFIRANTHYVITKYKLPMLMLSGVLPSIKFKVKVKVNKNYPIEVASITVIHINDKYPTQKDQSLGKETQVQILVEFSDLKVLSQAALKIARFQEFNSVVRGKEIDAEKLENDAKLANRTAIEKELDSVTIKALKKELDLLTGSEDSVSSIIGTMFNSVKEMEIVADYEQDDPDHSWVSHVASVFNMKFKLSGKKMEFVYSGSDLPVIPTPVQEIPRSFSSEAYVSVHKSLTDLLRPYSKSDSMIPEDIYSSDYMKNILLAIESLKEAVSESEKFFLKSSSMKFDEVVELDEGIIKKKQDPYTTLSKVRTLLLERNTLNRAYYYTYPQLNHSAALSVNSNENSAQINIRLAPHQFDESYDDDLVLEWDRFVIGIEDKDKTDLVQVVLGRGSVNMTLTGNLLYKSASNSESIDLTVNFNSSNLPTTVYMTKFSKFYESFESDRVAFNNFILAINSNSVDEESSSELKASWPGILPTSLIKRVSENVSKALSPLCSDKDTFSRKDKDTGFLDNLAKSHFDFIGYGFYRLIFNAMLPNPSECPNLSPINDSSSVISSTIPFSDLAGNYKSSVTVLNVELNLPPASAFIFVHTESGKLHEPVCVAAINTSERLRLWTQIVDGVLCNMYSVADGLEEQKKMLQTRIDSAQSKPVIDYFAKVLELHSTLPSIKTSQTIFEHPVNFKFHADASSSDIPSKDRIALLKAVPVNIEILNFEHMIRIVDAMAEKSHVIVSLLDPSKQGIRSHDSPSLFNNIISTLGSSYPIHFNSPETLTSVAPKRQYFTEDSNMKFSIVTESPNSRTLSAKMNISMLDSAFNRNRLLANAFDSLRPEERFLYPVIRWGEIDLLFAFPKFFVKLHLSSGDIKVTDDGAKIVFDALRDFNINLNIEARDTEKLPVSASKLVKNNSEIFKCTSMRQVFKRCYDFFKKKASLKLEDSAQVINTSSKVSYGPKAHHQYSYLGLADINNFFLLQGAILRKMFSGPSTPARSDDPTVIDFGMLISMRSPRSSKTKMDRETLPKLTFPCFFTNLCSKEQLSVSKLNQVSLVGNDGIPVKLYIRNTFQPLTASIAAGMGTLLSIFHFEAYPKTLEWRIKIGADQVIGMEMNGIGMFVGKADPLDIVKYADIPYPSSSSGDFSSSSSYPERSKVPDLFERTFENHISDVNRIIPSSAELQWDSYIPYENRGEFEKYFYRDDISEKFTDEVMISVLAQIPETLPTALRTVMLSLFFDPLNNIALHPPLFDPENQGTPGKLNHVPMSMALSDSINFLTSHNKKLTPSLLTKLFASFIEEFSNGGLDVHSLSDKPSASKVYYSYQRAPIDQEYALAVNPFSYIHINFDVIVWLQFPWALGSIGFDFGSKVTAKILHENELIADLSISKHRMIGKVAKMRMDISIKTPVIKLLTHLPSYLRPLAASFLAKLNLQFLINTLPVPSFLSIADLPFKVQIFVDNTFYIETEFNIGKEHFELERLSSNALNATNTVKLTPTSYNVDSILEKYKAIPNSTACVYNRKVDKNDIVKQSTMWSILDLSATKVYYEVDKGIKPDDPFKIFFQLFTKNKQPVCGLLNGIKSLAVMFEHINPSLGLDLLFQPTTSAPNQIIKKHYYLTEFNEVSSIFFLENVSLKCPGRYRIYVALDKYEKNLKSLTYKLVEFNEVYIENSR